ncbi:MAG: hypothetical protein ACI9FD_001826 [Gammaproteobacteria bacterium]|jgi:hypothetical protein
MRMFKFVVIILVGLWSSSTLAGSGHSHSPVDRDKAGEIATQIVASFVNQGTLEKSWENIVIVAIEEKEFSGNKEWVAVIKNPQVTDEAKQTLYVFLSLSGEYLAANYTGN